VAKLSKDFKKNSIHTLCDTWPINKHFNVSTTRAPPVGDERTEYSEQDICKRSPGPICCSFVCEYNFYLLSLPHER